MRVKGTWSLFVVSFVWSFLFCVPVFALLITEIQYDPQGSDTDREWIEVFNETNSVLKFTDYKFFENDTNHSIKETSGTEISSGEYVVIVQDINKFKTDFPSYSGKIFTSSFSLSNSGELLAIKDKDGNAIHSVNYSSYLSGAGNGKTINFDGTTFLGAIATPGSGVVPLGATSGTVSTTTTSTTSTTTISSGDGAYYPTYYGRSYLPESEKIYLNAGQNLTGLTGAEVTFFVKAVTGEKRDLINANYFWSFGDGMSGEGATPRHTYFFPGEYTAVVEVFANGNKETDRVYVKIADPNIKISLGNKKGVEFISLLNNSNNEVVLGGLSLNTEEPEKKSFVFPKNFSILGKREILIPQTLTKFATGTEGVKLLFPNGEILAEIKNKSPKVQTKDVAVISKEELAPSFIGAYTPGNEPKIVFTTSSSSTIPLQAIKPTKVIIKNNIANKPTKREDNMATPTKIIVSSKEKSVVSRFFERFGL